MTQNKLSVGIGYTKNKRLPLAVCDALYEGIKKCGDEPFKIKTKSDLKKCDVITQYGPWNGGQEKIRGEVEKFAKSNHIRKLCLDIGFIKNYRLDPDNLEAYTTIGWDDFKGRGKYCYEHEIDRWKSFNIEIKPWRTIGNHILLLGQPQGWSTQHFDINEWYSTTIEKIRQITKRPILFRMHPLIKQIPKINVDKIIAVEDCPLEQCFENCWAVVTKTSSAVIAAVLAGIPILTDDSLCPGYYLAEKNINNIERPKLSDNREFFFEYISYSQWNLKEIASGQAWSFYRKYYE